MWLIKKFMQKIFKKKVKWIPKDQIYNNHVI
jgi:hypothetical protein